MSVYSLEYDRLKHDRKRVEVFKASGDNGMRIFPVLNSNIKTLKTVGEYIEAMYPVTTYDPLLKQKSRRVKEFGFRSLDNHEDLRAITRSHIVMTAGYSFGGYGSAFVTLLLYILLLDTGGRKTAAAERAAAFVGELPVFVRRRLYRYAKEIDASDALLTRNIYQEIVVLYGDQTLYREFLSFISATYPREDEMTELFVREAADAASPIAQRMQNFQRSALKKEALYAVIFYSLDQYVRKCKMKGLKTGKRMVEAETFLMGFLDYFDEAFEGSLTWLGYVREGETIETLKDFIRYGLNNEEEREELYRCIRNAFCLQIPEEAEEEKEQE